MFGHEPDRVRTWWLVSALTGGLAGSAAAVLLWLLLTRPLLVAEVVAGLR